MLHIEKVTAVLLIILRATFNQASLDKVTVDHLRSKKILRCAALTCCSLVLLPEAISSSRSPLLFHATAAIYYWKVT